MAWVLPLILTSACAFQDRSKTLVSPKENPVWAVEPIFEISAAGAGMASRAAGPDLKLIAAISGLRKENKKICATMKGNFLGGLANTMAMINEAMYFMQKHDVSFIMPKIQPPGHDTGSMFEDIFGGQRSTCESKLPVHVAACPRSSHLWEAPGSGAVGGICDVSEMVVMGACYNLFVGGSCGCDVVVALKSHGLSWTSNYTETYQTFSKLYWDGLGESQKQVASFPLATSMHIRLGDAKELVKNGRGCNKYVPLYQYVQMIHALAEHIDPRCLDVSIVTDGNASEPEIVKAQAEWSVVGANSVTVLDATTPADKSFSTMTHSMINLGGDSGFPRLAAVVSRAEVFFFVIRGHDDHPLSFLDGATDMQDTPGRNLATMSQALSSNQHLQKLATKCQAYLASKQPSQGRHFAHPSFRR